MDAASAKRALRADMRRRLAAIGPDERREGGERAAAGLTAAGAYREAALVLAFLSMPSELDTGPAIRRALADGKRVAVPRIEGGDIAFVELARGWEDWPRDAWGIPAPPLGAAALTPADVAAVPTLALVPGLAFDSGGGRLGRGKGYYDRWLSSLEAARTAPGGEPAPFAALGYGYGLQLVDRVPMDERDRRLDGVLLG